jgi:hypothetical protein
MKEKFIENQIRINEKVRHLTFLSNHIRLDPK